VVKTKAESVNWFHQSHSSVTGPKVPNAQVMAHEFHKWAGVKTAVLL
jgi:hypothetical protein